MSQAKGEGEIPIQRVEQTQKTEPVKIGISDTEVIVMMFQEMREDIRENRHRDREETEKWYEYLREENKKWREENDRRRQKEREAVSYTHLDVYKRQLLINITRRTPYTKGIKIYIYFQ